MPRPEHNSRVRRVDHSLGPLDYPRNLWHRRWQLIWKVEVPLVCRVIKVSLD